MSWNYSPELVAAFLEASCSDTEPLQPSSTTPTPDQFYSHGKPTEFSRLSRFGMTCEPLTESHGEELLTWFLAGFPVKTSALQAKAQDWTGSGQDFGEKWPGLLAKFDPVSCGWKTAQRSLLGDSEECSVIFPRSGMTVDGQLWELPMLERPTSVTGFGFWPTPTVCGNYNRKGASATSGDGLATAVLKTYPTPVATMFKGWSPKHNGADTDDRLDYTVERASFQHGQSTPPMRLNPNWVEWLMGWPIGHTELKPSGTAKSRNAELPHGKLLAAPLLFDEGEA